MMRRTSVWATALCLAAAGVWLAGVSVSGQEQGAAGQEKKAAAGQEKKGKKELTDKSFVKMASSSDLAEINSSELAKQRAMNPAVKQFANQMVMDHKKASMELLAIANKKGIDASDKMAKKHKEMYEKLMKAEGAEFDKAYMAGQVKAHEEAVKLFQNASQNLQDEELKAFAAKTLPVVQMHLKMARQLQGGKDGHGDKGGPGGGTDAK